MHRAGSTLVGVTVKVLFKMLITGRALGRDGGQLSPPAATQPLLACCQHPELGTLLRARLRAHALAGAGSVPGRWQGGLRDAHPAPLPEQDHPPRQAAHQQVGVGVSVHVQPPAQRVPEGLHAGGAQVRPTDHLGGMVDWGGEGHPMELGIYPSASQAGAWDARGGIRSPAALVRGSWRGRYLAGFVQQPFGAAVVDVDLARPLKRSPHSDICGEKRRVSPTGMRGGCPAAPPHLLDPSLIPPAPSSHPAPPLLERTPPPRCPPSPSLHPKPLQRPTTPPQVGPPPS